jgi:hypothetical protein
MDADLIRQSTTGRKGVKRKAGQCRKNSLPAKFLDLLSSVGNN